MKEAGGKAEKVEDLRSKVDSNYTILSGDDGLTIDFMKKGAKGVISVASNIVPEKMVEMVDFMLKGETEKAQSISDSLAGFSRRCLSSLIPFRSRPQCGQRA